MCSAARFSERTPSATGPVVAMTTHSDPYDAPLARADAHARAWLVSHRDRPVPASASVEEVVATLGGPLPMVRPTRRT